LNALGNTAIECNLEVSRLYNDSTPTGRLNLLFYGD
jgi:hypothetical protein